MDHFLLRLRPPRASFPQDASGAEMEAMGAHGAYWQGLAEDGPALAVGPVADPAGIWGMALVEVDDAGHAKALADADPIITAGLGFAYEVMPVPSLILRRGAAPAHGER
ncbi:YciI family protein [Xanthobacter sp. KR7-225]|uniref:YciI family protein n=1 Tax=Xanthobacter sp. KR7-225 TaxID=3156613 RepID=UPI0032B4DD6E